MGPEYLPGGQPPLDSMCNLAAQVLQHQSDLLEPTRPTNRWTRFGGFEVELRRRIIVRPRPVEEEFPCLALVVSHRAKTPENMTMTQVWTKEHAAARGMKVSFGANHSAGVVTGFAGFLGENGLREKLIGLSKLPEVREAIKKASNREPCWEVRFERGRNRKALVCIGSNLFPRLSAQNGEKLDMIYGRGSSTHLARESIVRPGDRKAIVQEELDSLVQNAPGVMEKLFGRKMPFRLTSSPSTSKGLPVLRKLSTQFTTFDPPSLVVGRDTVVPTMTQAGEVWKHLEKHGLYALNRQLGRYLKLGCVLLVRRHEKRMDVKTKKASAVLKGISSLLGNVGISADTSGGVAIASSEEEAVNLAAKQGSQAVVLCSTRGTEDWYQTLKSKLLARPAPGLNHMASQWVNLERDLQRPALLNCTLQICAKVGHSPFVLKTRPSTEKTWIYGIDVCHMFNDVRREMVRTFAAFSLWRPSGEVQKSWLNYGYIDGESVPEEAWRDILKKEDCEGWDVVVHRDGRFTNAEKEFLADYAKEIGVASGAFHLVELVKWAGGTPRLYNGRGNAPVGSFLRLSKSEGLLLSGSCRTEGTRNPLLINVVAATRYSLEELAEDVFRMSWLSFSSAYAQPRLPVTTRAADKAAYFLTCLNNNQKAEESGQRLLDVRSTGRQQYWL
eukprot:CAMPEP_0178403754 /NCGR_PEP_ID=MMETSP0689_2-20121128/17532_1 /TAXON_ID=160604 /ORGANISM="Amphidinium massartii, Strain CS-259" /LENGTH=669 /DNA_ID=CAMNT_0020024719 /DNA_START=549 /DNA_END=2558 /DNA_ORIENTATION=-